MRQSVLLGEGRQMAEVPRERWEEHLAQIPQHGQARLNFMSEEHHQVRYFVVRELPYRGEPLAPETISQALQLPLARVETILEELEEKLVFLVRNKQGRVAWAYPVTVEPTPHRLHFSSGEQLFAA